MKPIIKWAQRKDIVYIEVEIPDITNEKINLTKNSLDFKSNDGKNQKQYEFVVHFYNEIISEESKWCKTGFKMSFMLKKKEQTAAYWPRLTQETVKSQYIQCNWSKWIDQDEQQEQGNKGINNNYDPQSMNNFNDSDDQPQEQNQQKQIKK